MKKYIIIIAAASLFLLGVLVGYFISSKFNNKKDPIPFIEIKNDYNEFSSSTTKIKTYDEYLKNKAYFSEKITEDDFLKYNYILVSYELDNCGESINNIDYEVIDDTINIYYDINSRCGICLSEEKTDVIKINKMEMKDNVKVYYKVVNEADCPTNVAYKPMIYIYPNREMDLTIKLGNESLLTSTYPKYDKEWNIHVLETGNIFDYKTSRNYYGLYWEAIDNTKLDFNDGFVVEGKNTVKFLEEKLAFLGLNEYEINEFITYWISKLENNKYNYFRFRTEDEINNYMPINFSEKPDTIIRILIDFKSLDEYMEVKPQILAKTSRVGFSVIEWGMVSHN